MPSLMQWTIPSAETPRRFSLFSPPIITGPTSVRTKQGGNKAGKMVEAKVARTFI